MPNAHLEYSTVSAGLSIIRVTCSIEMAQYLVERLTELAQYLEGKELTCLIIDCTYAVKAALDAMEQAIYGAGGRRSAGIRTSLN